MRFQIELIIDLQIVHLDRPGNRKCGYDFLHHRSAPIQSRTSLPIISVSKTGVDVKEFPFAIAG